MLPIICVVVATGLQIIQTPFCDYGYSGGMTNFRQLIGEGNGEGRKGYWCRNSGCSFSSGLRYRVIWSLRRTESPGQRAGKRPFTDLSLYPICSGGIIFIIAYNVLGSIFRGIEIQSSSDYGIDCKEFSISLGIFLLVAIFHMGAVGVLM